MRYNILFSILLALIANSSSSQIIFEKKNAYFGQVEDFEKKTIEFQCLNKHDFPIRVSIESVSNNVEVKIPQDTIDSKSVLTLSVNLFPTKLGAVREKVILKFSDDTKVELNINGYITSFAKNYSNSLDNHQLFGDREIVFMVIDGHTQKPIPLGKIYIANLQNNKSYIGYADKFGILKNKIPEGKYLIQSLIEGYESEIAGVKTFPDLNMAQVLLDRKENKPKALIPKKEIQAIKTTDEIAKLPITEPIKPIENISLDTNLSQITAKDTAVKDTIVESLRRPLNIIMLIDNSISMGENNRMNRVKESISHLVKNYNSHDQLTILTFNEEVNTILPPTKVTSIADIQSKIDEISVSGKTNGEIGINKAFEIMQNIASTESLNMIVLATDGRIASNDYIERKILKKVEDMNIKGYLLSVMGFTGSNYASRKMQQMSDIGGGLYLDMTQQKENNNSLLLDEIYNTLLKIDR